MFAQSLRLGKILGIPFGVNASWFIVFGLITLSLTTHYANEHPEWGLAGHIVFGTLTSILFFGSVVLHELGHSVMALRHGIPVKAITLFVFGGVAQIGREPEKPSHEFTIAVAGPVVSGALSGMFLILALLTRDVFEPFAFLSGWLADINLLLALFNLIPGFPLDGGRILRAIVWKYTGSFERASKIAGTSGQIFAYAFILFGVYLALTGPLFNGLWIVFIGWFLLNAAQATSTQAALRSALKGTLARDVISPECLRLSGSTSIFDLVHRYFLKDGTRCTMVVDGNDFRGLVTLHEVKRIPQEEWDRTSLQSVMIPAGKLHSVDPETALDVVLQRMNDQNINQIPVIENGKFVGIIARDRLLALIQMHMELKL